MTRPTWLWGGILLILSVLPALFGPELHNVGVWTGDALFCAALIVFAVGRDSVTARRPLGTITLIAFGAWPLIRIVFVAVVTPFVGPTGLVPVGATLFLYASPYIQLALGIIATVQIARAGAVTGRWRWVPLIGLAVASAWYVLMIAVVHPNTPGLLFLASLTELGPAIATLGVGVVSVIAAVIVGVVPDDHGIRPAVPVFPSAE